MGKVCKTCGLDNPPEASKCSHCGTVFDMKQDLTQTCGFCGKPNPLAAEVCEFCGAYLLKIAAEDAKRGVFHKRRVAKYATSPKNILPPSVEIRVLTPTPVNRVRFPVLPPKPSPPGKTPKGRNTKTIVKTIAYACIYGGFFAVVGWLLVLFFSIFF